MSHGKATQETVDDREFPSCRALPLTSPLPPSVSAQSQSGTNALFISSLKTVSDVFCSHKSFVFVDTLTQE